MADPIRVLFVCRENACRSQMAEGFARRDGGSGVAAWSAGSSPRGQVDAGAIEVMREQGIDLGAHRSKGVAALPAVTWDVLVSMGCGEACPTAPARRRLEWAIPDPKGQPLDTYRAIRDQIEAAVRALLADLASERTS